MSTSAITNPFVKIGGSLAEPSLEIKPLQAATATGAAVATAGLSILAQGMYDRVTSEKKVCRSAVKMMHKQAKKRAEAGSSP